MLGSCRFFTSTCTLRLLKSATFFFSGRVGYRGISLLEETRCVLRAKRTNNSRKRVAEQVGFPLQRYRQPGVRRALWPAIHVLFIIRDLGPSLNTKCGFVVAVPLGSLFWHSMSRCTRSSSISLKIGGRVLDSGTRTRISVFVS